jgi:hypothetical protein
MTDRPDMETHMSETTEETRMSRFATWISEWIETLRIAPPFSKRRRDIITATRDINDPDAWVEVERPS